MWRLYATWITTSWPWRGGVTVCMYPSNFRTWSRQTVMDLLMTQCLSLRTVQRTLYIIKAMKGSPCCAGLMRSCLHTYRTESNMILHIIQPWGWHQPSMEGAISQVCDGHQPTICSAISQVWGGHEPTMGGAISQVWGVINQLWGGPSAKYGGGGYFPTSMNRNSKSRELL